MNNDLKEYKVSFQTNTWDKISKEISISKTLNIIKSNYLKNQILYLRQALAKGNKEYYSRNKLKLPAVTFCGTFNTKRIKEDLKDYNSLIVIDIDKLSMEEMNTVEKKLFNDDFVFSYWRSPSNNGFKGLIRLSFSSEISVGEIDLNHKYAFKKLSEYFYDKHSIELDKSGNDITRLCFLSYDEGLIIKEKVVPFQLDNSKIETIKPQRTSEPNKLKFSSNKDALNNPLNRNNQYDRKLMSKLIRFLNNKNISITESYDDWYKTAMAISNSFTYDVGINYFIKLSKRDSGSRKFNEIECANFLTNCYENRNGQINLASIIYLANKKGFKTKYQKNGVPKVED